jgi:hypothetical protein
MERLRPGELLSFLPSRVNVKKFPLFLRKMYLGPGVFPSYLPLERQACLIQSLCGHPWAWVLGVSRLRYIGSRPEALRRWMQTD